jgi:hypothetical protein
VSLIYLPFLFPVFQSLLYSESKELFCPSVVCCFFQPSSKITYKTFMLPLKYLYTRKQSFLNLLVIIYIVLVHIKNNRYGRFQQPVFYVSFMNNFYLVIFTCVLYSFIVVYYNFVIF